MPQVKIIVSWLWSSVKHCSMSQAQRRMSTILKLVYSHVYINCLHPVHVWESDALLYWQWFKITCWFLRLAVVIYSKGMQAFGWRITHLQKVNTSGWLPWPSMAPCDRQTQNMRKHVLLAETWCSRFTAQTRQTHSTVDIESANKRSCFITCQIILKMFIVIMNNLPWYADCGNSDKWTNQSCLPL